MDIHYVCVCGSKVELLYSRYTGRQVAYMRQPISGRSESSPFDTLNTRFAALQFLRAQTRVLITFDAILDDETECLLTILTPHKSFTISPGFVLHCRL